jgi:hypothetical protein
MSNYYWTSNWAIENIDHHINNAINIGHVSKLDYLKNS